MPAINQEWLNQNANRAYPIREDMQRIPTDADGTVLVGVQLPNFLLVDLVLTVASPSAIAAYIREVAIVGNLLTVVIADATPADRPSIASLTIDRTTHRANTGYNVTGSRDYEDARGHLVIGDLTNLADSLADGLYRFTPEQAALELTTIRPALRGVRSLQLNNAGALSQLITGKVQLVAGENVRLTFVPEFNAIFMSAAPNSNYQASGEECGDCEDPYDNNVVRSINGIPVRDAIIDSDGSCTSVTTSGNRITIRDSCNQPCCGCPELEYLTESLKITESGVSRLENWAMQLTERMNTFITNYIISTSNR